MSGRLVVWVVFQSTGYELSSPFGFVAHFDPESGQMIAPELSRDIYDVCNLPDKRTGTFHQGMGLAGRVIATREPVLVNDVASEPHSSGVPEKHVPIERFLSAPALVGDRLVAQVAVANADRDYTEGDLVLIRQLASL